MGLAWHSVSWQNSIKSVGLPASNPSPSLQMSQQLAVTAFQQDSMLNVQDQLQLLTSYPGLVPLQYGNISPSRSHHPISESKQGLAGTGSVGRVQHM